MSASIAGQIALACSFSYHVACTVYISIPCFILRCVLCFYWFLCSAI